MNRAKVFVNGIYSGDLEEIAKSPNAHLFSL